MTTLSITLSSEDEELLKKIKETNKDLKTFEDALLWCLHQQSRPALEILDFLPKNQTVHIQLGTGKRVSIPHFPPRPAPQIKKNDRVLLITGKPGDIENVISKISKDFHK